MKNQKSKNRRFGAKTKSALAATLLTAPLWASAQTSGGGIGKASTQDSATTSPQNSPAPDLHVRKAGHTQLEYLNTQPTPTPAQAAATDHKTPLNFLKLSQTCSVVGSDKGHIVYQNSSGKFFTIDASTGDQTFLTKADFFKFKDFKQVTILGVDPNGHVIQKNANGQKFYLNQTTGDMVLVK